MTNDLLRDSREDIRALDEHAQRMQDLLDRLRTTPRSRLVEWPGLPQRDPEKYWVQL